MFEAMAQRCYSQKLDDINIYEFGLIPHEKLEHFGASPDGINELGVMIEIKCPYSRKIIKDFIPSKYILQIQGQLSVCNLRECDYIECNFKSFDNYEDYISDKNIKEDDKINHGIIIELVNNKKEYQYIYSDPYLTKKETLKNVNDKMNKDDETFKLHKYTYWRLIEMTIQKVDFNELEWNNNIEDKIIKFWEKVEATKLYNLNNKRKNLFIEDDSD